MAKIRLVRARRGTVKRMVWASGISNTQPLLCIVMRMVKIPTAFTDHYTLRPVLVVRGWCGICGASIGKRLAV